VFAVQFRHDEQFAAGSVVLTTLLSILFLPLCALALTMF
jgi:predicted permeases